MGYEPNSLKKFSLSLKFVQSRAPSFHSWNNPKSRIKKNEVKENTSIEELIIFIIENIGNINLISISKIKNSTIKIKNRIEKGIRISLKGSKPHSNGVFFSE